MSAEKITVDEEYLIRVMAVVAAAQALARDRRHGVPERFICLDMDVIEQEVDALRYWGADHIARGGHQ
ncbi:hypothetical protein FYJ43_07600 [Cutibacterium sp. WCA-380-WT-3A]|uniref:Uncharacterized protein n=1 Tax=Cutibacterium porci TaxID=2605781 RepID=A0A7K0J7G7_9ACTN|nr:hypothetical protein [Cutibacterium porci]MSS45902.1 hypothetical protein [Cutibacterium porci]